MPILLSKAVRSRSIVVHYGPNVFPIFPYGWKEWGKRWEMGKVSESPLQNPFGILSAQTSPVCFSRWDRFPPFNSPFPSSIFPIKVRFSPIPSVKRRKGKSPLNAHSFPNSTVYSLNKRPFPDYGCRFR